MATLGGVFVGVEILEVCTNNLGNSSKSQQPQTTATAEVHIVSMGEGDRGNRSVISRELSIVFPAVFFQSFFCQDL